MSLKPEDQTVDPSSFVAQTVPMPDRVGPYKLLEMLGEGGMGIVYRAEQTAPMRRVVALKLVKPGMDSREVLARFESERQALALLNHPNIARVLDAGTSSTGHPFFVMEFIAGAPITQYCDLHRLPTRDRLELFLQVCDAVQHAHRKGIIHRDLKPTNVLVTLQDGKPVAKVIDFGVAKALDQRLSQVTLLTEQGRLIGTPEYMSPEQAEMSSLDIDTRTDVYSLGVLLYELLAGVLPFDSKSLRSAALAEIQRIIREVDPPKPSTRLSSLGGDSGALAQKRAAEPSALVQQLKGDLDWITMKAIEKDRTRRYGSASELADDLKRYLNDEPVTASPPSAGYRLSKFVRRHRASVIAASLIVLALIAGLVGTSWQAYRAMRAERLAFEQQKRAEARFEQVRTLVHKFIFDYDRAIRDLPGATKPRAMLVETAQEYLDKLSSDPSADDALLHDLGMAYQKVGDIQGGAISGSLGDTEAAIRSYAKASEIYDRLLKRHPDDPEAQHDKLSIKATDAAMKMRRGQTASALADYREYAAAMETLSRAHPSNPKFKLNAAIGISQIAELLSQMGKTDEALAEYNRAIELRRQLVADNPADVEFQRYLAMEYCAVGEAYYGRGDLAEARQWHTRGLSILNPLLEKNPDNAAVMRSTALTLERLGDSMRKDQQEQSLEHYKRSMKIRESIARIDPADVGAQRDLSIAHDRMGRTMRLAGKPQEAVVEFQASLAIRERLAAKDPLNAMSRRDLAATHMFIGQCYSAMNQHVDAIAEYEQFVTTAKSLTEQDPSRPGLAMDYAVGLVTLANTHLESADTEAAPEDKLTHLRTARGQFDEGRQVCQKLKDAGKLPKSDANAVEEFAEEVRKCDEKIARLTGATTAPATQP